MWQSTLTSCENFPSWYLTRYSSFPHCTVSCCPSRRESLVLFGSQCCSDNWGTIFGTIWGQMLGQFSKKNPPLCNAVLAGGGVLLCWVLSVAQTITNKTSRGQWKTSTTTKCRFLLSLFSRLCEWLDGIA